MDEGVTPKSCATIFAVVACPDDSLVLWGDGGDFP